MPITDITDQFEGVNEYDLIYRSESGYTAKIRVADISPGPAFVSFLVTGSWADDQTGRAREFGDGHFIVEPHETPVRPHSPVNLEALVQDARVLMVGRVEAAAINYAARQALVNIKPKASLPSNEPSSPALI